MYPQTYTCLQYSGIVTEVEFFKQILGSQVVRLLVTEFSQKSQTLKGVWLG